jgi:hypothetical protein
MATSLSLENDSSLAQGYLKVNGSTAATLTTSGITGNLTGNVTGNATTATKLSTASGSAPSYACRAWVNFDGTRDTTGAVSTANTNRLINASGNVASVLRNAAGDYTITFTTAMTDINYSLSGMSNCVFGATIGLAPENSATTVTTKTTSNFRVITRNWGTGAFDMSNISIQVFGN